VPDAPAVLPALPSPLQAAHPAEAYARASLAPATLRAYQSSWQAFLDWCALAGHQALPATPATVAEHLASLAATHSRASLAKRLSAIGQYHRLAGTPSPPPTR
jgi:site-specific recombinase XerD